MRYEDVVLADGPSGYWPLNETSGSTAYDLGSTGVNGTYTNSPTLGAYAFPAGGRAPHFAGASSQQVTIADNNAWSPDTTSQLWTAECWIYTNSVTGGGGNTVFGKGNEWAIYSQSDFGGVYGNACLAGFLTNSGGSADWSRLVGATGTWRTAHQRWAHVAIVGSATATSNELWVNGKLIATGTAVSGSAPANQADALVIGYSVASAGRYHTGGIAHCAYYGKQLTRDRIIAHYRAGLARPVRQAFRTRAA